MDLLAGLPAMWDGGEGRAKGRARSARGEPRYLTRSGSSALRPQRQSDGSAGDLHLLRHIPRRERDVGIVVPNRRIWGRSGPRVDGSSGTRRPRRAASPKIAGAAKATRPQARSGRIELCLSGTALATIIADLVAFTGLYET